MRRLLIISTLLACQKPFNVFAQSNFIKTYNDPGFQNIVSIVEADNHDYVLAGSSQIGSGGLLKIFIVKTDVEGKILWKKYFGDDNGQWLSKQVVKSNLGYTILGMTELGAVVQTINSNGDLLSQKIETDSVWEPMSLDFTPDRKGFIIVGEIDQGDNYLLHNIILASSDLNGNISSARLYGLNSENESPAKAFQLSDGGCFVIGTTTESSSFPYAENILIFRTDPNGDIAWKKIIGGVEQNIPFDMTRTSDGSIMIACYNGAVEGLEMIKIKEDGTLVFDRLVNGSSVKAFPTSIAETQDGDFLVTGESIPMGVTPIWKISANGLLTWQKLYLQQSFGTVIVKTSDGNFLASGEIGNGVDTDFFLLKIGADGCNIIDLNLPNDTIACSEVRIVASEGYDTYEWNNGVEGRTIKPDTSGIFIVRATINEGNCQRSDTIKVMVKDCYSYNHCTNISYGEKDLEIPNVFTPNDDKLNELFVVPDALIGSKISVYNNWGSLVYFNDNYDNTWNGGELSNGVYYYTLTNVCMDKSFKGTISIFR